MNIGDKHFEKKDIQTILKHDLLEKYTKRWASVLIRSKFVNDLKEVNFADCFAGKGRFDDGNIGSPLIAMESLFRIQNHFMQSYKIPMKFNIHTIELDQKYHQSLVNLRKQSKYPNQVFNYPGKFEDHIKSLLYKTDGTPSFYFIDPFGYTGLPLKKITEILERQSHEVFINVMSYSIVRNIRIENNYKGLLDFFGMDSMTDDLYEFVNQIDKNEIINTSDKELLKLEDKIIALYKDQLKSNVSKEIFVLSKRISSKLNPNVYFHLVFATSNILGLEKMKEAFVDFDEHKHSLEEDYVLKNNINDFSSNLSLFDDMNSDAFDYKQFLYSLQHNFNNKETSLKQIVVYFLENTPLAYRFKNDENSIYGYLKKIEKTDHFYRTKGTIAQIRNIGDIKVNITLTDEIIYALLNQEKNEQLTLF